MLIQKNSQVGEIIVLKLTSAEEIIGRFEGETPEGVVIGRPLTLTWGQKGVGMTSWIVTADPLNSITVKHDAIMARTTAIKTAADQYITGTSGTQTVTTLV
jgi:hypothetical protein